MNSLLSRWRGPAMGLLFTLLCLATTGCTAEEQHLAAELNRLSEQVTLLVILMGACWVVMSILAMSLGISVRKLLSGERSV